MDAPWRDLADELGPMRIDLIRDPSCGLEAILVVDNVAAGPAIGGIRMAADVDLVEVFRLARAMTLKNAAAGLPHGGGKAGIVADAAIPRARRESLVRAFARAIGPLTEYIPGPDMGIDESCMAFIHDEIGRSVGLPRVLGGIPLDTLGATGYGVAVAAEVAEELGIVRLDGARAVVQGFGAVGRHGARFLGERGVRTVGVSDSSGARVDAAGFDLEKLHRFKEEGGRVVDFPGGEAVDPTALVGLDCEIWVPAARPDVFTGDNADLVQARLILQGANIPATPAAEKRFHERGVVSVPDFIANAGGVICAAVEFAGGSEAQAFAAIDEKIRRNTREVLQSSRRDGVEPRVAAVALARARVEEAMRYRRSM